MCQYWFDLSWGREKKFSLQFFVHLSISLSFSHRIFAQIHPNPMTRQLQLLSLSLDVKLSWKFNFSSVENKKNLTFMSNVGEGFTILRSNDFWNLIMQNVSRLLIKKNRPCWFIAFKRLPPTSHSVNLSSCDIIIITIRLCCIMFGYWQKTNHIDTLRTRNL